MKRLLAALALFACVSSHADVALPKIFSDNMVLQQGQKVKVWGTAKPGAKVDVEFAKQKQITKAGADGKWTLTLNPLKANSKADVMKIYENGKEVKIVSNVLVGEVWITGGQSNMEFGLRLVEGSPDMIKRADYPEMRFFWQPSCVAFETPQADCAEGSLWRVCSPDMIDKFSAVSFLFAEKVMKEIKMPVGVVLTAMSGTPMVAWVAPDCLETSKGYEKRMAWFKKKSESWDYAKEIAKWNKGREDHAAAAEKAKAEGKPAPALDYNYWDMNKPWEKSPDYYRTPAAMYNGKIAPILGFAARGFVWYQGENDSGGVSQETFQEMFEDLIDCWRKKWNSPEMPFIFAQLPSWGGADTWADVREKQAKAAAKLKNVWMAVTIDTGDEKDIHPKDKLPVAERLANIALKELYGKKNINAFGPEFKSAELKKGAAVVNFEMHGMKFKPAKDGLTGFEVFDGAVWLPAKALIKGSTVTLSIDSIKDVKGVRYAYKSWAKPEAGLFNENGLPAAPFNYQSAN